MKACEEVKKQDGYPTPEEAYIEARNLINRGKILIGLIQLFILQVKKLLELSF